MREEKPVFENSKLAEIVADLKPRISLQGDYALGSDEKSKEERERLFYDRPSELSSGGYEDWAGDSD